MTDPLRPFARAIHSLWHTRAGEKNSKADAGAASAASSAPEQRPPNERLNETLQSRLQACMLGLNTKDPKRLREAFVETVLLWEIGGHLAPDPALGEFVASVADQIASDPTVGERLHRLLLQLSTP
jgi:hypothetical protein